MSANTPLRNVAVFGAGGKNIGYHLVKSLLAQPEHFTTTIIARKSSKSTYPPDARLAYVPDDLPHSDLVDVLRGQDVLISAVGGSSLGLQRKVIDAAVEAGVRRFLPSEYGINNTDPRARALSPIFNAKGEIVDYLKTKEKGGLTWTSVASGLWLDWALEAPLNFMNVDVKAHTVAYFGDGNYRFSFTTLPSAAYAVTQVLLHPEETANRVIAVENFEVSQKDVVEALQRVQGVKYTATTIDVEQYVNEATLEWKQTGNIGAAIRLVKIGIITPGYGSNLVTDGSLTIGNKLLGLKEVKFEDVIKAAA